MVINDYDKLIKIISNLLKNKKINIISFDGVTGSGKSTLASKINKDFSNTFHINLDEYLEQNKGGYLNYIKYIKYDVLKKEILELLEKDIIVLIDGICVLEILDKINIPSDLTIYVKRILQPRYWFDGSDFDYSKKIEDIISQENDRMKKFEKIIAQEEGRAEKNIDSTKTIKFEILKYHFKYKPDLNSNIIFERLQ